MTLDTFAIIASIAVSIAGAAVVILGILIRWP